MRARLALFPWAFVVLLAVLGITFLVRGAPAADPSQNTIALPTEAQILAFVKAAEADKVAEVVHDSRGEISSVTLRRGNATDQGLVYASRLRSLRSLTIHGRLLPTDYKEHTAACLRNLTNLVTLKVLCTGPLQPGFFRELCTLRNLRELQLTDAPPPRDEYSYMTGLMRLEKLGIASCTNFGNKELAGVTNLPNLRSLQLVGNAVTQDGTNVLGGMKRLTDVVFIGSDGWLR